MKIDRNFVVILKSAAIGDGEPDLGKRLMQNFLKMLLDSGNAPSHLICMNSAVFLTTDGSPVAEQMQKLAAAGSEILSCSTCLEYFNLKDKLIVGQPTTMRETVIAIQTAGKVVTL